MQVLLETDDVDLSFCAQAFPNFRICFQHGENKCGGMLVMARSGTQLSRVKYKLLNVCSMDMKLIDELRIVAEYTPPSKPMFWNQLS